MRAELMAHFRGDEIMQLKILQMTDSEVRSLYNQLTWRNGYGQYE